jgi:phytoene dehydrogenase-like protein
MAWNGGTEPNTGRPCRIFGGSGRGGQRAPARGTAVAGVSGVGDLFSIPGRASAAREAIVIGAGPNGLSAALVCAAAGFRVHVYEAERTIGGGARTAPLTLPGFLHDHCASIFPLGIASPFFRALPIEAHGVSWLHGRHPLAHPLDDGDVVVVDRSVRATADGLGKDGGAYERLLSPFVQQWEPLLDDALAPPRWPRHPWLMAGFGMAAVPPATWLAGRFATVRARALLAGLAAHSGAPLDAPLTAAFALLLGALAHAVGWPVARGGAQAIPDALASHLEACGGAILTGHRVDALSHLPPAALTLCDIAPEQLARLGADRLPPRFRRHLGRFQRGPGVFKVDWALDGPIPWTAEACSGAPTVHVGGTLEEIAAAERAAYEGRIPARPFVILAQPSVCDPTRAPEGRHVAWGYCHVPTGATADMTEAIEGQVERFAPGFRDRILARHTMSPAGLARGNASLIGGDISGGAVTIRQMLARPSWRAYGTPVRGLYLCSASTPPGGGVHGMCGYWAARRAIRAAGTVHT